MKANPLTSLWPIGHVADRAGVTRQELERVADELKVEPIFWLCGVPYFCMLQAIALDEEIKHRRTGAPREATEAMRRKVAAAVAGE